MLYALPVLFAFPSKIDYCTLKVVENSRIQNEFPSGHVPWDSNLVIKTYPNHHSALSIFEILKRYLVKVHIFWEGYKILRNLHLTFDWNYIGQK